MNKLLSLAIAAVLSLGVVGAASAGTDTSTVSPTATITSACTIGTATLNFGSVSGMVVANVDATGAVSIECTTGAAYNITANQGLNASKAKVVGRRVMVAGANASGLDYDLFTSSAYAIRMSATQPIGGTSSGGITSVPLYGRVFSGQTYSFAAGVVSDTVGLTITF